MVWFGSSTVKLKFQVQNVMRRAGEMLFCLLQGIFEEEAVEQANMADPFCVFVTSHLLYNSGGAGYPLHCIQLSYCCLFLFSFYIVNDVCVYKAETLMLTLHAFWNDCVYSKILLDFCHADICVYPPKFV